MMAAVTFTSGALLVVEPLYARQVLHRPPSQFALFEAAAGVGAFLAGLGIACVGVRRGIRRGGWKVLSASAGVRAGALGLAGVSVAAGVIGFAIAARNTSDAGVSTGLARSEEVVDD